MIYRTELVMIPPDDEAFGPVQIANDKRGVLVGALAIGRQFQQTPRLRHERSVASHLA
jgi:hypothetical protein